MPELKKEQEVIINHDNGNVMVSASAGSGKTFVMIKRLIRLITEKKVGVNQILAITFTDASAFDMREKLKKALGEKISEGHKELAGELNEISTADISTVHSFCARLVRLYFFMAGVSPDFNIIDANLASTYKNECIDKTFKEFYDCKDRDFLDTVSKFARKRSDRELKDVVLSLYNFCASERSPEKFLNNVLQYYTVDGFNNTVKEYENFIKKNLTDVKNRIVWSIYQLKNSGEEDKAKLLEELLAFVEELIKCDLFQFKGYKGVEIPTKGIRIKNLNVRGNIKSCKDEIKSIIENACGAVLDRQEELDKLPSLYNLSSNLIKIVNRFTQNYNDFKAEENVLDFDDLERCALKVLSDEGVLKSVREKYKYIFVDEYQDINDVQEEIISLISQDNLFMVGDVKQSIYGFRGCNPDIFRNKFNGMVKNKGSAYTLNCNFRSAKKVIETVNEIFSFCMTENYFGSSYSGSELNSGGVYKDGYEGRAELHLLKKESVKRESESPRIYDILDELDKEDAEKNQMVTLIADIINRELKEKYYDPKNETCQQVTFKDIAILTRKRDNKYVQDIVKGLIRRGIPVESNVEINICDFPEVQTLINALKLIKCMKDDIPLASVLKSPIGNFTEEDLAEITLFYRDNGGKESFYSAYLYYLQNGAGQLRERLFKFDEYFKGIRFASDFLGAKEILNKLAEDSDYFTFILAKETGENKLKRVKKFISLAKSGKELTVNEMLRRIEYDQGSFTMTNELEENTVKIMTIHASKGLEFPVVIVCGLEQAFNSKSEDNDLFFDKDLGFATRFYDEKNKTYSSTLLRALIKEKSKFNDVSEELRLFYVATTRAMYSLHLTFTAKQDERREEFYGAGSFLDYIPKSLPVSEYTEEELNNANCKNQRIKVIIGKGDSEKEEELSKRFAFNYEYNNDVNLPLKSSVTASLNEDKEYNYTYQRTAGEETDKDKGIIAHKFLQYFDFNRRSEYLIQAKEMVDKNILTEEELNGISLEGIGRAINSEVFDNLQGKTLYREKQFISSLPARKILGIDSDEGVLTQGIIDLLIVYGDKAEIVDYKYSALKGDLLMERYKKQLELYAYAVESALKVKVVKKSLLNVLSGEIKVLN